MLVSAFALLIACSDLVELPALASGERILLRPGEVVSRSHALDPTDIMTVRVNPDSMSVGPFFYSVVDSHGNVIVRESPALGKEVTFVVATSGAYTVSVGLEETVQKPEY